MASTLQIHLLCVAEGASLGGDRPEAFQIYPSKPSFTLTLHLQHIRVVLSPNEAVLLKGQLSQLGQVCASLPPFSPTLEHDELRVHEAALPHRQALQLRQVYSSHNA